MPATRHLAPLLKPFAARVAARTSSAGWAATSSWCFNATATLLLRSRARSVCSMRSTLRFGRRTSSPGQLQRAEDSASRATAEASTRCSKRPTRPSSPSRRREKDVSVLRQGSPRCRSASRVEAAARLDHGNVGWLRQVPLSGHRSFDRRRGCYTFSFRGSSSLRRRTVQRTSVQPLGQPMRWSYPQAA